jgi:hypothetical protein
VCAGCYRSVALFARCKRWTLHRGIHSGGTRLIYHQFLIMWRAQSALFGHVLRSLPELPSGSVTRVIRNGVIFGDFRRLPSILIRKMLMRVQRADPALRLQTRPCLRVLTLAFWFTGIADHQSVRYGTCTQRCNKSQNSPRQYCVPGADSPAVDSRQVIPESPADWPSRTEHQRHV